MISTDVADSARKSVLCWLATCDEQGAPNVSPKEVFAPYGSNRLVIANIASPTSVRNINTNPAVCVSFIDVFVQKGFKVKGTARNVQKSDPDFSTWAGPLEAITKGRFPIHSVIVVEVEAVEPIVAPSYRLFPTEKLLSNRKSRMQCALMAFSPRTAVTPNPSLKR